MTPERLRKIKELGDLALEREPAQRAAFLAIALTPAREPSLP